MSGLARRYRLLLCAYPRGARREELLGTLLQVAVATGSTRPTAREAANLLCHGFRARLGRPASRLVVVPAVIVALTCGVYTAAGAAIAAWHLAPPPLPDATQLAQLQQLVTPGIATVHQGHDDALFVNPALDGMEYGTVGWTTGPDAGARDADTWMAQLRERLEDAGWHYRGTTRTGATRIDTGEYVDDSQRLVSTRGHWAITVEDYAPEPSSPDPGSVSVDIRRTMPWWVGAATVAGMLPGLLVGWLVTGWVSRRTEGHRLTSSRIAVITAITLMPLAPLAGIGAAGMVMELIPGQITDPFWGVLLLNSEFSGCPTMAALLAAVVLADATFSPWWLNRSRSGSVGVAG